MADPGWILPELAVESVLQTGLRFVREAQSANTLDALIARIYANADTFKRAQIKELLSTRLPEVIFHHPADHQRIPCWVVTIDEESNSEYVGDSSHVHEYLGGEQGTMPAESWTSDVGILTYDDHPERVQWLYHLSKWIISASRRAVSTAFPLNHSLRGRGFEQWKAGEAGARLLYRRTLILKGQYEQLDARLEGFLDIQDVGTSLPANVGYGLANL